GDTMALTRKIFWIVKMNTDAAELQFSKHALAVDATGVCIRTSSKRLPDAIKRFHDLGMKVYAWRWPPSTPTGAMREADNVASNLIPAGLDGYIVDPESDRKGASNDWNQQSLAPLAAGVLQDNHGCSAEIIRVWDNIWMRLSGSWPEAEYPLEGV